MCVLSSMEVMKEDFHPGWRVSSVLLLSLQSVSLCVCLCVCGSDLGRDKEVGGGGAKVDGEKGSSACQSHGVDNLFQFTAQSLPPG